MDHWQLLSLKHIPQASLLCSTFVYDSYLGLGTDNRLSQNYIPHKTVYRSPYGAYSVRFQYSLGEVPETPRKFCLSRI